MFKVSNLNYWCDVTVGIITGHLKIALTNKWENFKSFKMCTLRVSLHMSPLSH
jgi:hypothetical protein